MSHLCSHAPDPSVDTALSTRSLLHSRLVAPFCLLQQHIQGPGRSARFIDVQRQRSEWSMSLLVPPLAEKHKTWETLSAHQPIKYTASDTNLLCLPQGPEVKCDKGFTCHPKFFWLLKHFSLQTQPAPLGSIHLPRSLQYGHFMLILQFFSHRHLEETFPNSKSGSGTPLRPLPLGSAAYLCPLVASLSRL